MTFPATIMLNSRAATVSYCAGFAAKKFASTETPKERPFAAARLRSVVVGCVTVHLAWVGSCWQVFSVGTMGAEVSVALPPQAARASRTTAGRARAGER